MNRAYLAFLLSCLMFVSCEHKLPPPLPPVPVNLYAVTAQRVFYYDKYPATTVALSQVNLLPEVQGYITGILFTEGSHVHKGQELYEIDKRIYQDAYDQAEANLKVAQSNQVEAQQDADRYTYLNTQDAIAKQTLDHAVITLETAKDQVAAAEQTLKTAKTNLEFSVITAPFDGTIGFSQVKLGDEVTVGQTVLNTVSTDDPMGVDFLISEKQLPHFEELKDGKQETVDSLFTIVLPNDSLYHYTGKISVIDRAVDPQTGTIRIRVVFPNPGYLLRPGTSCVLRVHNQEASPQMIVPSRAVLELMGEYFVFVDKDTVARDPKDSTKTHPVHMAIQKKVVLGQTIAPNVIVKSGIKEGVKIVVDGVQSLHTGSIIALSNKPNTQKGENGGAGKQDSSHNSSAKTNSNKNKVY
jgi:RND family efflux transporter MFP subunit